MYVVQCRLHVVHGTLIPKKKIEEVTVAEVYEDFDKRQEHRKRFGALPARKDTPQYSAPAKGRPDARDYGFVSDIQSGLADELLDLSSTRRR